MEIKNVAMQPTKKLDDEIFEVLDKEINNYELLNKLNDIYTKKNLNLKTISCLFEETKEIDEMTVIEKIAFAEACYEVFKDQGKENWYRKFEVERYFSQQDLMYYDTYIEQKEIIDEMYFENCRKIDDYNYRGIMTGRQVFEYLSNMLLLYNKDTQRASTLTKIGTKDKWVRKITLNKKSVRDMADKIKAKKFEESEVILNIRLISKDKTPQFEFEESCIEGIGNILIKPNYDRSSPYTTYCEILDGYHRLSAISLAMQEYYNEKGEWLDVCIGVKFVLADQERALRIVEDTFKRSDTDKKWLKAIQKNDTTKFIDKFIDNSEYLRDNVTNTYEECVAFHKKTYKSLLVDVVNKLDIKVNSISTSNFMSLELAEKIDELMSLIDADIKGNEEYKYMYSPNIYAGYIKAIYLLTKKENFTLKDYKTIIEKAKNLSNEELKSLKLNSKNFTFKNVFNLFDDVLEMR